MNRRKARALFVARRAAFLALAGTTLFTAIAYNQQRQEMLKAKKETNDARHQLFLVTRQLDTVTRLERFETVTKNLVEAHEQDEKIIHELNRRLNAYEAAQGATTHNTGNTMD
jgi:hypothetical protein